jgi:hypothetical protein
LLTQMNEFCCFFFIFGWNFLLLQLGSYYLLFCIFYSFYNVGMLLHEIKYIDFTKSSVLFDNKSAISRIVIRLEWFKIIIIIGDSFGMVVFLKSVVLLG